MEIEMMTTAMAHVLFGVARRLLPHHRGRDAGAVSLEQVLWFVAAGVAVAVIATILWGKIRNEAEKPITPPAAP